MGKKILTGLVATVILLGGAIGMAAEPAPRKPRIALLIAEVGPAESQTVKGLRDGLKELGYREGENILIETKDLKGDRAALKPAAEELVGKKVDLIFTTGTRATQAAIAATKQIPIVFRHPGDPVALGFVKSLKHPGGNVTGVAALSAQTTERRLEILKEIVPNLRRVHIFYDSNDPYAKANFAAAKKYAAKLRLEVAEHSVKSLAELKASLGALQKGDGDAIFHFSDDLVESQADLVFDTARQKGLPTMFEGAEWAPKGSMISYGVNYTQMGRQAAALVDKILKGEKPKGLPVERASKYDLLINLRMVNAIGLTVPPETLKKADKVIR